MQKYITTALLCGLLWGRDRGSRAAALNAQPEVNNRPTQGPIVERHGGLSGVANAMADDDSDAATGLTQIGTGVHSLVGEIGRMPLASVLAGIVPDNFRVLLDDPNLLLGVQVSWRNQQPLTDVLTEVADEYGIDFTLDWNQRALLVEPSAISISRPVSGDDATPAPDHGPAGRTPSGAWQRASISCYIVATGASRGAGGQAPTSLFIPFACGFGDAGGRAISRCNRCHGGGARGGGTGSTDSHLTGISRATGASTPRERLLGLRRAARSNGSPSVWSRPVSTGHSTAPLDQRERSEGCQRAARRGSAACAERARWCRVTQTLPTDPVARGRCSRRSSQRLTDRLIALAGSIDPQPSTELTSKTVLGVASTRGPPPRPISALRRWPLDRARAGSARHCALADARRGWHRHRQF